MPNKRSLTPSRITAWISAFLVFVVIGITIYKAAPVNRASLPENLVSPLDQRLIQRGAELAIASDRIACHTAAAKEQPFSGGYGIDTPIGKIYSSNITPSRDYGIGKYTAADFSKALRQGIRIDGSHLYPAMPYTAYSGLTDKDVLALYAYFMRRVTPVDRASPSTDLPFPFNIRLSMVLWNFLFFKDRRFVGVPSRGPEWNRGAYLTNVLAHCSACHTPRNFLMAEQAHLWLSGAQLGPWYAPNITSDAISGIGAWKDDELLNFLKSGHAVGKSQAAAGMAEAVENSLHNLPDDDLKSIIVYLRSTAPVRTQGQEKPSFSFGTSSSNLSSSFPTQPATDAEANAAGRTLFNGYCASCHRIDGRGSIDQSYPSLYNNSAAGDTNPSNLVAAILYGVDRKVGATHTLMPGFGYNSYVQSLDDSQVADVSNYVLQQFGNRKLVVTAHDVALSRRGGRAPFLAWVQPFIVPIGAFLVFIVLAVPAVLYFLGNRRRRHLQRKSAL